MTLEEFEQVVDEVIKNLPEEFKSELDNVDIIVDVWPRDEDWQNINAHPGSLLFGLYRGIPKTKRLSNYSSMPDKILIYAGPILMVSHDLADAKVRIKETVLHEIGHHFGLSEEKIRKAFH